MLALCYALPGVSSVGDYDPCAGQASVSKSDGFSLGLAFYPGGAAEAWGTLHPCPYADRAVLAARGVATMVSLSPNLSKSQHPTPSKLMRP